MLYPYHASEKRIAFIIEQRFWLSKQLFHIWKMPFLVLDNNNVCIKEFCLQDVNY